LGWQRQKTAARRPVAEAEKELQQAVGGVG
jgi:hypothetical protein